MINKLKEIYNDQYYGFVVKMVLVYGAWKVLLKSSQVLIPFKAKWEIMMGFFLKLVTNMSLLMLKLTSYEIVHQGSFIAIKNTPGVVVGPACIGIGVMFVFSGLIWAFKGEKKLQLKFIVFGIFVINFLNALRVTILCVISGKYYEWVEFNHKYVFNNLLYICVILIWIWYVNITNKKLEKK